MLRRIAVISVISIFATSLSVFSESAHARAHSGKKKTRKIASSEKRELVLPSGQDGPIDELEEQLYTKFKNKTASKLKAAWADLETKKYDAAQKAAMPLIQDQRFGDYARWIAAQAVLQIASSELAEKNFAEAKKHAQSAINLLSPVSIRFPYSPLNKKLPRDLATAESIAGRANCEAKKWKACETSHENALTRVMGTPDMAYIQPDDLASYSLACSKTRTEVCVSWMQRLAAYYPKSTEEFKAIAKSFPEIKERIPHPAIVGKLTQAYRSPDLDQTAIDSAMQLYLDGKNKDAIEAFRRFNDEFPRSYSRFRARYWLAQALKKSGKTDEAKGMLVDLQKTSPLTYYGLLAAIEIEKNPYASLDPDPPAASDFDPFLNPSEIIRLRRAQNLLAAKAYGLAAIELRDLRARDGLSSAFLIYLAMLHTEARSWVTAFTILNDLISRGNTGVFSQYFAKLIFPTDPMEQVKKFADEVKIDPVLVLSLIKQESSFDTAASSSSGALGLMQLMPTTAVDTVAGIARFELLGPEPNLKTGTLYLSKLLSRFQGNMIYATASYNAGPGAVNRWIKTAPQGRTMLEFIESIPYKETREYVSAIVRNYFWYTHRLNPDGISRLKLDFFWHNYGPQPSIEAEGSAGESSASDEAPASGSSPTATPSPDTSTTASASSR